MFGDIFQLLDRDAENVSEYQIQASEDVKKYLADQLGGDVSNYGEIKIPDNMFIWATMNSADRGSVSYGYSIQKALGFYISWY